MSSSSALALAIFIAATLSGASRLALAEPGPLPFRPSVTQAQPDAPTTIAGHGTADPLVREKYAKSPDLMRFIRGTYGEVCVRGLVNEAAKTIKANIDGRYSAEKRRAAAQVLEAGRIWRLSSLEMEALFKTGYVHASYYCDCLVKELTDDQVLDPEKGAEVMDAIPASTQATCERLSSERTEHYEKMYGQKK